MAHSLLNDVSVKKECKCCNHATDCVDGIGGFKACSAQSALRDYLTSGYANDYIKAVLV